MFVLSNSNFNIKNFESVVIYDFNINFSLYLKDGSLIISTRGNLIVKYFDISWLN